MHPKTLDTAVRTWAKANHVEIQDAAPTPAEKAAAQLNLLAHLRTTFGSKPVKA